MNGQNYIQSVVKLYRTYQQQGERAVAQVPNDADLHTQFDPVDNSIAIIVKHVAGNLRSRFTDFLTTDGEKPTRNRDGEFEMPQAVSRTQLLQWWADGFRVALSAIEALEPEDLDRTVHIRGEAHSVIEALNRSVTHTAYHAGQIVYLARHFAGEERWKTLSLPKRKAAAE